MPRHPGEDKPSSSGYSRHTSPYPHGEQAKLRGNFNARHSTRPAKKTRGSPNKGASFLHHLGSPTSLPRVDARRLRSTAPGPPPTGRNAFNRGTAFGYAQAGPSTVPSKAKAFHPPGPSPDTASSSRARNTTGSSFGPPGPPTTWRLRCDPPKPPSVPVPVPGSSFSPINVDVDSDDDVNIEDAFPSAPVVTEPPNPKPKVLTRQYTPFRMPGGPNVDCNDFDSVYTPRTSRFEPVMEDANEHPPPSQPPAPESTFEPREPVGGSSRSTSKNKGKGKSLRPTSSFDFDGFSEAIETVGKTGEMSREKKERLAAKRAEEQTKKHLRYEEARQARAQEKRRQIKAEKKKRLEQDAQAAAEVKRIEKETRDREKEVHELVELWEDFDTKVTRRDRFDKEVKQSLDSGSRSNYLVEKAERFDSEVTESLVKVKPSIEVGQAHCEALRQSRHCNAEVHRTLQQGRHKEAAEQIAQLQAKQDHILAALQEWLSHINVLCRNNEKRPARLDREREERLAREKQREHERRLAREHEERLFREYKERLDREREERLAQERARLARGRAQRFTRTAEEVQAAFAIYESKWATLRDLKTPLERHLTFSDVPWPVFAQVNSTNDLTVAAVKEFLLHPARPLRGRTLRTTIHSDLLCYHDDKFKTSVLDRVGLSEDNREWNKIKEGGGEVIRILTDRSFLP
ncbi:hypothetical protein NLI96_g7725 [Meripilus lineatus]|uniref:Uncharacterized protein n=1 Tax=Meripilus lineatus TaxID=2056292 RepID=A0AAD5YCP3_9APHY|nr:hypothetical protein NLI96_g7725 [Physisporinus lineatus]